jgi:hypothetical protein
MSGAPVAVTDTTSPNRMLGSVSAPVTCTAARRPSTSDQSRCTAVQHGAGARGPHGTLVAIDQRAAELHAANGDGKPPRLTAAVRLVFPPVQGSDGWRHRRIVTSSRIDLHSLQRPHGDRCKAVRTTRTRMTKEQS